MRDQYQSVCAVHVRYMCMHMLCMCALALAVHVDAPHVEAGLVRDGYVGWAQVPIQPSILVLGPVPGGPATVGTPSHS